MKEIVDTNQLRKYCYRNSTNQVMEMIRYKRTRRQTNVVMEEYFETDVKFKVDSDTELDRSKDLKHEFLSDRIEEYFERDVKSDVESDVDQ